MNKMQSEMLRPRKWFDFAETGSYAEFYIYDVIGSDMWDDGIKAIDFINQVKNAKQKDIHIHINSPGGIAFDGVSIFHALQESKKNIRTITDGIAASAASIVFMAGTERHMPLGSMLMIHKAWTIAAGNELKFIKNAERLKKLDEQLASIYASASNHDVNKISKMMEDETYIDSKDAVDMGFATEIIEGAKIAALKFDKNLLPGLPESFNKMQSALNKRDIEAALRDAGWSISEAKKLASGPRDAENDEAEILKALANNIEMFK